MEVALFSDADVALFTGDPIELVAKAAKSLFQIGFHVADYFRHKITGKECAKKVVSSIGGFFGLGRISETSFDKFFGKPITVAERNAYQTLGCTSRQDYNTIKKAYHRLVSVHHPDKGGDREEFGTIQTAWAIIQKQRGWN